MATAAKGAGATLVTLLVNAGSIAEEQLFLDSDAVIEAFYPSFGAPRIAELITGKANSWGRLPYTVYSKAFADRVSLTDLGVAGPGRTYRYAAPGDVLYEFGAGMSYTVASTSCTVQPSKQRASVGASAPAPEDVLATIRCSIMDSEPIVSDSELPVPDGDEVLLAFHRPTSGLRRIIRSEHGADHPIPHRSLIGFERTPPLSRNKTGTRSRMVSGDSDGARAGAGSNGPLATVAFAVRAIDLALTGSRGEQILYPGEHNVIISGREPAEPVEIAVNVHGTNPMVLQRPPDAPLP